MNRRIRSYIASGAVVVLCGCVAQLGKSSERMLSQDKLEQLFSSGKSVEFVSSGKRFDVSYYPDGRQEISWGSGSDKGNFSIRNGEFCSTWSNLRKGEESCSKIYQIGDNEFVFKSDDGNSHATMRVK